MAKINKSKFIYGFLAITLITFLLSGCAYRKQIQVQDYEYILPDIHIQTHKKLLEEQKRISQANQSLQADTAAAKRYDRT